MTKNALYLAGAFTAGVIVGVLGYKYVSDRNISPKTLADKAEKLALEAGKLKSAFKEGAGFKNENTAERSGRSFSMGRGGQGRFKDQSLGTSFQGKDSTSSALSTAVSALTALAKLAGTAGGVAAAGAMLRKGRR